ncbi:Uncharacterised protein [Klebsiella variicola]|jgi:hypothetical protein|nr:Uncharacterised protein [Klebsiella variicola]
MYKYKLRYVQRLKKLNAGGIVDTFVWWLGLISALASIGSAIWAAVEARSSAKSASQAELVRDRMVNHRYVAESHQLLQSTRAMLQTVSAIGPSCMQRNLRGLNVRNISAQLVTYCTTLNENSYLFADNDNPAIELSVELLQRAGIIAAAQSLEDVTLAGRQAFTAINLFLPKIKQISDERRENV